VKLYKMIQTSM